MALRNRSTAFTAKTGITINNKDIYDVLGLCKKTLTSGSTKIPPPRSKAGGHTQSSFLAPSLLFYDMCSFSICSFINLRVFTLMAFSSFFAPCFLYAFFQVVFGQDDYFTFNASFVPTTKNFLRRAWGSGNSALAVYPLANPSKLSFWETTFTTMEVISCNGLTENPTLLPVCLL